MIRLKFSYVDGGFHPKLGRVLHWQQLATGYSNVARYNQYLCQVLGSVAQVTDDCDRLIQYICDVESGRKKKIETGGNDVTLTITPTGIQVDIEINEEWIGQPDGQFKLGEWKAALAGWRRFLQMPKSLDSVVEIIL
jgi:hypothetical protein